MGHMTMDGDLTGIGRCPHCQIANPQMPRIWISELIVDPNNVLRATNWATFKCTTCSGVILAKSGQSVRTSIVNGFSQNLKVTATFPQPTVVDEAIPASARTYLSQAHQTLHAPDAAAVMAASAVDAMLKDKGYKNGSLDARIKKAVEDHLLTDGMGKWAHAVRLEANNVRHADELSPHRTRAEAEQVVEFAKALGDFLYVLTDKIEKGVEAAEPLNVAAK